MRAYSRVVSSKLAATTHLGGFDGQRRAGRDDEATTARPKILAPFVEQADRAEQPRQYRAMQIRMVRRGRIAFEAEIAGRGAELRVQVLPFAQAHERQEVLATPFAQRRTAERCGLFVKPLPQIQHGHEIRARIRVTRVRFIGLRLRIRRPLARILRGEKCGDDQQLRQAPQPPRGQQHARQLRIARQRRQCGGRCG